MLINPNPIRNKCKCGNYSICECKGCALHCKHEENPVNISGFQHLMIHTNHSSLKAEINLKQRLASRGTLV